MLTSLSAWSHATELISTTIPDEMESTAGDNCGRKSKRHRVYWLTSTVDEHEHFLHWLVGDHIPSKSPRSALIASPEIGERLLQSKEFEMWRTEPHSVLWLYGTGKLRTIWWFGSDILVTSHSAGSGKTALW